MIYTEIVEKHLTARKIDLTYDDKTSRPKEKLLKKGLSLKHVSYRYPGSRSAGLQDVSFQVLPGERIGIVGSTGAGKTTLVDIILGLLRPESGELAFDAQSITDDRVQRWQQVVGYVPQKIFLMDATVIENIAFGFEREKIDQDRVVHAAKIAQIHKFVVGDLENGYETHIGEDGVRLSGGQRQRIGIARAIYRDSEVIVFDEATSALDNSTEFDVMQAIDALPGDKTIFIVAHRLSTVRHCDKIIVMSAGLVAGFDTWRNLSSGNDVFRELAVNEGSD